MRTEFKKNVGNAIAALIDGGRLGVEETTSGSLFSPVFDGDYKWAKVMDSDGLFVGRRPVKKGEGAAPAKEVALVIGVVIQCEDTTSRTKPNPFGKAAIGTVRNGIWVDLKAGGRVRLDRVYVLFVIPKGAPPKEEKDFQTAKRNVQNAASTMPDADSLSFARGTSSGHLKRGIEKKVRRWLKRRGRPNKV